MTSLLEKQARKAREQFYKYRKFGNNVPGTFLEGYMYAMKEKQGKKARDIISLRLQLAESLRKYNREVPQLKAVLKRLRSRKEKGCTAAKSAKKQASLERRWNS